MLRFILRRRGTTETEIVRLFVKAAKKEAKISGAKSIGIRRAN